MTATVIDARPNLDVHAVLREVVERLAPLDRTPCAPGERAAAEWLATRLGDAGCEVALEDAPGWGPFPPTVVGLCVSGVIAAALALAGRRRTSLGLGALGLLGLADEVQNGPRILRRLTRQKRTTVNVVARAGDVRAQRTLLVLAHHDAAQTGAFYDQTLLRRAWELFPGFVGGLRTSLPQWWLGLAGALLSLTGRRRGQWAGLAVALASTLAVLDIHRSPTVPGANDNLSACAVLVALAERLRETPTPGVRVLLVSCGAEEALQDGIRGFVARHAGELPPEHTRVLNLDTVGSPELGLLEGEGGLWIEDYVGRDWRDEIVATAERHGIALERGFRARASTDGIIPSRAGLPTATLISVTPWRALANYHLPTDTPENLDYDTVGEALRLTEALVRS